MAGVEWPEEGPEVDVWKHIATGLQLADDELDYLPDNLRKLSEEIARALLEQRSQVVLEAKQQGWVGLDKEILSHPWIRYALDLEIASEGIGRATDGLKRYVHIKPITAQQTLPPKARRYIQEVTHAYIFGFDAACIALCRAALEQLLKDRLLATGVYTERRLKRERPTAGSLLEQAKQNDLLTVNYGVAKRVIERGDELMHSHIADEKVLRALAIDSIAYFSAAAVELLGGSVPQ